MKRKILTVAEAKSSLSSAIRDVEDGAPVMITRHGTPVAALVRPEDLAKLELLRAAVPKVAGRAWREAEKGRRIWRRTS